METMTAESLDQLLGEISAAIDNDETIESKALLEQVAASAQRLGLKPLQVRALILAANLADRSTDYVTAARHALQATAIACELDDAVLIAEVKATSAAVSLSIGDLDAAFVDLEAALPVAMSTGLEHSRLRFHVENRLGIAYANIGDAVQASVWYQRACVTAERIPAARFRIMAAGGFAGIRLQTAMDLQKSNPDEAVRASLSMALEMLSSAALSARKAKLPSLQIRLLSNVGVALTCLGRPDEALATFEDMNALSRAHGLTPSSIHAATARARIHIDRGELSHARQVIKEGLELGAVLGSTSAMEDLYDVAWQVEERSSYFEQALQFHKMYHAVKNRVALVKADQRAKVLTVRLGVEQARGEAKEARHRSALLIKSIDELAQRAESLKHDAEVDSLTGLANRRRIDAELTRMDHAARRSNRPLCAVLLDADHFKSVNDRHSHLVGDATLKELALILKRHSRSADLVGRYGGEEFLIVMADIDLDGARLICERLRLAVERHDWQRLAPGLALTISGGLCDLTTESDIDAGLRNADGHLYAAKAAGRNRIVCQGYVDDKSDEGNGLR